MHGIIAYFPGSNSISFVSISLRKFNFPDEAFNFVGSYLAKFFSFDANPKTHNKIGFITFGNGYLSPRNRRPIQNNLFRYHRFITFKYTY